MDAKDRPRPESPEPPPASDPEFLDWREELL